MYIPLNTLASKVALPEDEFDALTFEINAYDAIRKINNTSSFQQKTFLGYIENYQLKLPKDIQNIEMVALYVNADDDTTLDQCLQEDFPADTSETEHNIPTQSLNNQITAIYPLLPWSFTSSRTFLKHFELIRPRRVPFNYACKTCPDLNLPCNYHYDIYSTNCLVFPQLESGVVCVSYNGFATDEVGNVLIEDDANLHDAIVAYTMMKYHEVKMNMSVAGAENLYRMYKNAWSLYRKQYTANSVTKTLDPQAIRQIVYGRWDMLLKDAIKYVTTI